MPQRRRVLLAAILLTAACGGTLGGGGGGSGGGAAGGAGSTEPLKVGVVTGLTGAYVQLGEQQKNGAELAAKVLGGKVGNRPIQVLVRDDQLKPDVALRETQALVQQDKVNFLTGCVSAATTLAVNQVAKQAKVPYLASCQTEQLNRPPNYDPGFTYHLAPTPSIPAKAASPFICENLGKKVFQLLPDYAYGHEQDTAYSTAIPKNAGCTIAGTAFFPLGTTDFNPYIPKIEGSGAQVIVFGGAGRDQVSFLRQAAQFKLTDRYKTFLSLEDLSFDQELGFDLVKNTWATSAFYWTVADPAVQEYVKAYRDAYGQPPGGYGVYLYNAVRIIAQQVQDGNGAPDKFREKLQGLQVSLGQGQETIRPCDHQALASVYILKGLSAAEAASKGGDAKYGFREVVKTVPGSEDIAPTCDEVKQPFTPKP